MTDTRPTLYLSRLLPDPVMVIVRERFQLVQEPLDAFPAPSALREGLCRSDAAIVTLGDHIDAETIHAATRLKILANYAVGYNNIDLMAARQRGLIVTNTPDVLTDATADLTWALLLATARRIVEGDTLVRSGRWTGWSPTQLMGTEISGKTLGNYRHGTDWTSGSRARGRVSHAGTLPLTPTDCPFVSPSRVGVSIVARTLE